MSQNLAVKFAPVYSGEKRIDLAVENGETTIRLSSFVEGLGWSTQKSMSLDAELLDELHRVVSAARVRIKMETAKAETEGSDESSRVLQFPA